MPIVRSAPAFCCANAVALALLFACDGMAQTVWSGLTLTFTKLDGTSAELEDNQDRITDNVWITRNEFGQGLLNAASECGPSGCGYTHNFSPEDTEWATRWVLANSDEEIAASNWQQLTFTDWEDAYDNRVGQLILNPNYRDAVLHLITDDIYLDLRFTGWTIGFGGGFTYQRATALAAPDPTGDYNENGIVDAADYVLWRSTLDQPASPAGSGADGNSSGTIDAGDYGYWAERFGNSVPGAGGGGLTRAVPEPSAAWLLLLAASYLFPSSRNRSRS
jgi:hypothetical protein